MHTSQYDLHLRFQFSGLPLLTLGINEDEGTKGLYHVYRGLNACEQNLVFSSAGDTSNTPPEDIVRDLIANHLNHPDYVDSNYPAIKIKSTRVFKEVQGDRYVPEFCDTLLNELHGYGQIKVRDTEVSVIDVYVVPIVG